MDLIKEKEMCNKLYDLIKQKIDIRSFLDIKNHISFYPIEEMIERYNIVELNTAIKPYCVDYFFNLGYQKVIYIDPDIQFFNTIQKVDSLLESWDIILTPHTMTPFPDDGLQQDCKQIMQVGMNNCGFIAFKYSQESKKAIDFWEHNLQDKCYNDVRNGYFTDQKWTDWFPYIFDKVYILKDFGYNAAYWNIHERKLIKKDDYWYSNNDMLVFYHFSGLPTNNINAISKYQNRFCLEERTDDLKELFIEYITNVKKFDKYNFSKTEFYFSYIANTDCKIPKIKENRQYNQEIPYISDCESAQKEIEKYGENPSNYNFMPSFGINIIGYVEENHSIGKVARDFIRKISDLSIPFTIFSINSGAEKIEISNFSQYKPFFTTSPCYPINLIIVNADQISNIIEANKHIFENKYNIVNFSWEFETGFEKFSNIHTLINEIIVSTDYIKNSISKYIYNKIKITKITYPINFNIKDIFPKDYIKEKFSIDKNKFVFFFNFDYNSSYERKNPSAILKAFNYVFKDNNNVLMIFKTSNSEKNKIQKMKFFQEIHNLYLDDKVLIIDSYLSRKEMLSLINICDVYISLHLAEGFGLGMSEAMLLGKPVIASNYSGNLEFMNNKNSFLVETKVAPMHNLNIEQYSNVIEIREPNIREAAKYMKLVYENKKIREEIGARACIDIKEKFSRYNFKRDFYSLLCDISNNKLNSTSQQIKQRTFLKYIIFKLKQKIRKIIKNIILNILLKIRNNKYLYKFIKFLVSKNIILYKIFEHLKYRFPL